MAFETRDIFRKRMMSRSAGLWMLCPSGMRRLPTRPGQFLEGEFCSRYRDTFPLRKPKGESYRTFWKSTSRVTTIPLQIDQKSYGRGAPKSDGFEFDVDLQALAMLRTYSLTGLLVILLHRIREINISFQEPWLLELSRVLVYICIHVDGIS